MARLTISGNILQQHFESSVSAEKLIVGLEHIPRHTRKPIILIWDRPPVHRAKIVTAYLEKHPEIHREHLPGYAPVLNPEEYRQKNDKRRMKNAILHSKTEIRSSLDQDFVDL